MLYLTPDLEAPQPEWSPKMLHSTAMPNAYRYYLRLDGITGSVKVRGYIGWIEVLSWAETGGVTSGSATSGTREPGSRFVLAMQSAFTTISAYTAQGRSIGSAELHAVKSGRAMLIVKFENVYVTSSSFSGAGGQTVATFTISFENRTITRNLDASAAAAPDPMGWAVRTK